MDQSSTINNVLIIKPGAIGDILQLTPVIRGLKAKYPHVNISLLVGSHATSRLFKYNSDVRETYVYDKKGEHRSFRAFFRLWQVLRRNKFDVVINFQRSNLKTWLLAAAAFPCRILVYHKAGSESKHAVKNHLETAAALGIDQSNMNLDLRTGPDDKKSADRVVRSFRKNGPIVVLNPGASHPVNRWGPDGFAALADMLAEQLQANVIIIGGPDDALLAESIVRKTVSKPVSMAGKLDLLQSAALLERADLLVSGDTGPMHMATAAGTKVVALFGAADPARTGPIGPGHRVLQAAGVPCVPCRKRRCSNTIYLECMERISTEAVFRAITEILKEKKSLPDNA